MLSLFKRKCAAILSMWMALTLQVNGVDCNESTNCEPKCCDTECGVTYKVDLLYWRPELCGLEAAFGDTTIATTVDQNGIIFTTVTESDKEPHSKWNTGVRAGIEMRYNYFEVELDWTRFNGCAKFHEGPQFGHWKINYDAVDLTFGRTFNLLSCFDVKPFIGIRSVQIHQHLKSHLETLFTSTLIGDNTVLTDKKDKEKFKGLGPQIGINADWYIGCNLSLYGSFAVASYYGDVKTKNTTTDTFTQTVSVCNGKKKHCFNTIATDMAIGVRWDSSSNFCGCETILTLKLGAEQHRIYDFSELGADGTLSLDGGIFEAGITFNY